MENIDIPPCVYVCACVRAPSVELWSELGNSETN